MVANARASSETLCSGLSCTARPRHMRLALGTTCRRWPEVVLKAPSGLASMSGFTSYDTVFICIVCLFGCSYLAYAGYVCPMGERHLFQIGMLITGIIGCACPVAILAKVAFDNCNRTHVKPDKRANAVSTELSCCACCLPSQHIFLSSEPECALCPGS